MTLLMDNSSRRYRSYLLRVWQTGDGAQWLAMLQDVSTEERYHFADLESLCVFLLTNLHTQETEDPESDRLD